MPSCALIYTYYLKSSNIIETQVTTSLLQTLEQSQINISNKLYSIADISEQIFMDDRVKNFVGDDNNDNIPLQIDQAKELRIIFSNFADKRYNYRIRMFVSNKKIISSEKVTFYSVQDAAEEEWYKKVVDNKGRIVWIGTHSEDYIDTGKTEVLSCARVLKHSYRYEDNDGVLLIDIPESNLGNILSGIKLGDSSNVFIVDNLGKAVSHRDKSILGHTLLSSEEIAFMNSNSAGIKKVNKDGRDLYMIYQEIDATGWRMIAEIDVKDITKTNMVFNAISMLVLILFAFIVLVSGMFMMFIYIMKSMNKQVKNLVYTIEKDGVEYIDESISNASNGDLTRLEKDVYSMTQRLKNLMAESYQAKISEREAQLKALQAQINPHFLYNTLDAINWMAVKIKAEDISFMVNSLAKYFRLSLSKGKSIVSIKDELELINAYLSIQKVRFRGTIQFEFKIEKVVEDYNIHKLTLQPIVENAIIHGIQKNRDRSGIIVIEAVKEEEDIIFTISDNGVGMDKETIEKVLSNLPSGKEGSYGLYNVNERIKLYFGQEYGIVLQSEKGSGTKVQIKIKAI
jgi:two-component system sensor histidine kinase YesM